MYMLGRALQKLGTAHVKVRSAKDPCAFGD